MDAASPARLYCTLVGGVLVIAGIIGFFYEASFATGDDVVADDVFGILAVNGWHNLVHIALGLLGLAWRPATRRAPTRSASACFTWCSPSGDSSRPRTGSACSSTWSRSTRRTTCCT